MPFLTLNICEYECTCGNTWTHSRIWHKNPEGGYSIHDPAIHGQPNFKYITTSTQSVSGCHRCVPLLGIPIGTQAALDAEITSRTAGPTRTPARTQTKPKSSTKSPTDTQHLLWDD